MEQGSEVCVQSVFLDQTLTKGEVRLFGLLCQLDRESKGCQLIRQDLARTLQVSITTINHQMVDLKRQGYITVTRKGLKPGSLAITRVEPSRRQQSGFWVEGKAMELEMEQTLDVFDDTELPNGAVRLFGILCKFDGARMLGLPADPGAARPILPFQREPVDLCPSPEGIHRCAARRGLPAIIRVDMQAECNPGLCCPGQR